jgi:peptide/nickel transport system substrate-binding protein
MPAFRTLSGQRRKIVAFLLFLSWLSLFGCNTRNQEAETLSYGLTLAPSGIDPHINASVELGIPLSSVYDTLVFQKSDGSFVPGLAESWEISDDQTVYTFKLRQDVHFHDGEPFTAHAVVENIEYILNPEHLSQKAASMLGPLVRVEAVEDDLVVFYLETPFAPLLDSLSQMYLGIASPKALREWGPQEYQFHQVGTGPYKFVEYIPNDRLILVKNPDYAWGPQIYQNEKAVIERIEFRFYEDPATRALALESGEVDIIGEIPPAAATRLHATGDFNLDAIPIPGQPLQFFLNTKREPTDDPVVREALLIGVNRESIVQTVFGTYSPPARGYLSASTSGFTDLGDRLQYDPQRAESMLDAAGWIRDQDGMRVKAGTPLQVTIVSPPWGSNPEVAQLLKTAWEQMGIQVELRLATGFGNLKEIQSSNQYNAIGLNFFGSDPDLLRPSFKSDGLYNWSRINDPEIDSFLMKGIEAGYALSERQTYYDGFSELAGDQWLLLPIRDYVNLVLSQNQVEGLSFSPQGWFPYLIDVRFSP